MGSSEYEISIQSGYVLVQDPPDYEVVWSEQPAKIQAISDTCTQAGLKKVLIRGTTARVKLTVMELFQLGESVAKLHLKIAIVTASDESPENENFLENVASNRGSPLQFFDNEQDAREWLGV